MMPSIVMAFMVRSAFCAFFFILKEEEEENKVNKWQSNVALSIHEIIKCILFMNFSQRVLWQKAVP